MVIFLSVAYFSILFFFGWQVARLVFNENRIEHLITFSGMFGIGLYVFFINIVGLFIPIQTTFYLVLLVFLLTASLGFFWRRAQKFGDQRSLIWGVGMYWRKVLLYFALFLTISVSIIAFNSYMDIASMREPTAVTIAEGNFPPMEIWNPTSPLRYHYAPELFAAATYKITGVPIHVAYDIEKGIMTGVLFLLGFLLIRLFFPDDRVACLSSLSMMYAGSLVFFSGFSGIPTLYRKYFLGQDIPAPFKFISDATIGEYTAPLINSVLNVHWGAMAFALMMAVIYIYFFILGEGNKRNTVPAFFTGGFLFALLALVAETYFAVLSVVIFLFPFVYFFLKKDIVRAKKMFISSLFLLLIAVPIAFFQGGVLGTAFKQQLQQPVLGNTSETIMFTNLNDDVSPFRIGTPWTLYDGKPLHDSRFLLEFTLLFIVLIPAIILLYKRRFEFALFLTGLLLMFFFIPVFIDSSFPVMAGQFGRFFYPVPLFAGLVIGTVLTIAYLQTKRLFLKRSILILTLILVVQGIFTHSVWLAFGKPSGTWNPNDGLVAERDTLEARAYDWVKENTTIKETFLVIRDSYDECGQSTAPNCLFILNTGRMAPIFLTQQAFVGNEELETSSPYKAALFDELTKNCDPSIVHELNFSYMYVNELWKEGMEGMCASKNKLEVVFEEKEGPKFVRIYKIIRDDSSP